jgi:hypothetical protein
MLEGEIKIGDELLWGTGDLGARERISVADIEERDGEVWVLTSGKRKTHWVSEAALREACVRLPVSGKTIDGGSQE